MFAVPLLRRAPLRRARVRLGMVEPGAGAPSRTPYWLSNGLDDQDLLTTTSGSIPGSSPHGLSAPAHGHRPFDALAAQSPFVSKLLRGYVDGRGPVLMAGYGNGGSLLVDFVRQQVIIDQGAWERLRARHELPRCADGEFEPGGLTPQAATHELDALVWFAGLAAGALPLLGAPAEWRDTPVRGRSWVRLRAFLRMPAHLHLAEMIATGATTPERLRRATRVDLGELRAFLQAGLFLQALEWGRTD